MNMNKQFISIILGLVMLFTFLSVSTKNFLPYRNTSTNKQVFAAPETIASTGWEDRQYWADLLYNISYPVVHNLAEGTLRKNMPIEAPPDYRMSAEKVTHLEAVGRTVAGIAPWLTLPDDETKEGHLRKQLRLDLLKGLSHVVDPASNDYLDFRTELHALVDAAFLAHGLLRAQQTLWEPLNTLTKTRLIDEFKFLRIRQPFVNNWILFAGIIEVFLMQIGEQYDRARIDLAISRINEWYKGDGWYGDGERLCIDYYNSYVIHPMLVDMLQVTVNKNYSQQHEYDTALKRMVRYSEFLERSISPEGTYPVFGRSITYRTAAFQALAQTALMGKLPEHISSSQVRCALTKVMHNMYDNPVNFDSNGWLVLGFNGHQPMMADVYTSTGSLYMTTLSFLPLGLSPTDPFWTDPPTEWTSKKAWNGHPTKKDYSVAY